MDGSLAAHKEILELAAQRFVYLMFKSDGEKTAAITSAASPSLLEWLSNKVSDISQGDNSIIISGLRSQTLWCNEINLSHRFMFRNEPHKVMLRNILQCIDVIQLIKACLFDWVCVRKCWLKLHCEGALLYQLQTKFQPNFSQFHLLIMQSFLMKTLPLKQCESKDVAFEQPAFTANLF